MCFKGIGGFRYNSSNFWLPRTSIELPVIKAFGIPQIVHNVGLCLLNLSLSSMSSWIKEKLCTNSTDIEHGKAALISPDNESHKAIHKAGLNAFPW